MISNDIDPHDSSKSPSGLHRPDSDEEQEDSGLIQAGDYSSRMGEIMDGENEGDTTFKSDSDDDEVFVYSGFDSTQAASHNYRDRLREALGRDDLVGEDDSDDDDVPEQSGALKVAVEGEGSPLGSLPNPTASINSLSPSPRTLSPIPRKASSKIAKTFLDPNVSRLRSHSPSSSQPPEAGFSSSFSHLYSFSSSHILPSTSRALSRASSVSNSNNLSPSPGDTHEVIAAVTQGLERDVFRWANLETITREIYASANSSTKKAMTVLGTQRFESPTVLAANGYVCVGTSDGKILVYDFRQNLQCLCGQDLPENHLGAVTALALSHDHTCVAAGYSTGYIQIYNLSNPATPIRSVPPTSLSLVYSGRKEGHIQGSCIISIGFVSGRHTAVVSADIYGLAFYHSLGKVLFVEAPDILRILGRYPDPSPPQSNTRGHTVKQRNPRYTILMMAPLPLGTSPHVTDKYNLVAMLTPTKMVVVGLKPSPKTWFKIARGLDEGGAWRSQTKWRGTLAWFPSIFSESNSANVGDRSKEEQGTPTAPILAFSWGHSLRVVRIEEVRIRQVLKNVKTGREKESEVGAIDYQSMLSWAAEEEILAMQWLNSQQLAVLTESEMGVFDLRESKLVEQLKFDFSSLMSPSIANTVNGNVNYQNSIRDVSHSMRVYKGKVFLLGRNEIRVGTLLTWADKILSLVENGDFLSAIELTRSYYLDEAPGNRNSLPTDSTLRKEVIGDKLRDLMIASTRYAFSDDRMTDSTHVTPDGRGVDRTVLFESLVVTCCHACIALDDTEFLFEELFQKYDDSGILRIYLRHLEPFMLSNEIRYVPPRITQRLINLHEEDGRPDLVERVIWHIDPACLDINQAIHLCQRHSLYDALIYVHTRALRDYVAPIVEILGLIRRVMIHRREKAENGNESEHDVSDSESSIEPMILHSYKVYPYLSHVLSGLTYPSGEPLPEDEAFQAKKDIYTFLFYGRSTVWPSKGDGKLILTSDEEGGVEPTHPYIRQLLLWDSESFLHSLDIAFEDPFLHDETQKSISRLIIVRILLELVNSDSLPSEDAILVHIFIARNAPKYPHFLFDKLSPTILHNTLLRLATGGRLEAREDRQLAAEYLLSVYKPHDTEEIYAMFEAAGFYRILRTWYRRDRRWDLLFMTYLNDSDIRSPTVFEKLDEVLVAGVQSNKGIVPEQLALTLENSLVRLLELGEAETALLVQAYDPQLHRRALDALGSSDSDEQRLLYLQALFSSLQPGGTSIPPSELLSVMMSDLGHIFINLQCRFHPRETIRTLEALPSHLLQWDDVIQICERNQTQDAVVWALDVQGEPQVALDKAAEYQRELALQIVQFFSQSSDGPDVQLGSALDTIHSITQRGVDICLRRSHKSSDVDIPLEDIWFTLLNSQIGVVQLVSACQPSNLKERDQEAKTKYLTELRSLVQKTFGALVSITSTSAVSFPRLFKRLVNSTTSTAHSHYDEFRTILTGMLESYRSDGDMLMMTKNLVERDLFDTMARYTRQKSRGWAPDRGICIYCRHPLSKLPGPDTPEADISFRIILSRAGKAYHSECLPN